MEKWRIIPEFPKYEVSHHGYVRSIGSSHQMSIQLSNGDVAFVKLSKDGVQYTRSLARLVAEAFVPRESPLDDTPIHLDTNPYNNAAINLMWKPRWWALSWARQFRFPEERWTVQPVINIRTETRYTDMMSAALTDTQLCVDIWKSMLSRGAVGVGPHRDRYDFWSYSGPEG